MTNIWSLVTVSSTQYLVSMTQQVHAAACTFIVMTQQVHAAACMFIVIHSIMEEGCSSVHTEYDESFLSSDSESEPEVEQPSGGPGPSLFLSALKLQPHQTWHESVQLR